MKAVVMCGGAGSRLKPLTENVPKPLIRVLNKTVLEIVIEKLMSSGINEIYLSLGYMANEIISFCESRKFEAKIIFCEEAVPLGTAGGVKNCIDKSEEDILVVSGDNIFDFDINKIADYHFSSDADITVCATEVYDPREYGSILTDDDGSVASFIEKPTWEYSESFLINTGIYILKGNILNLIPPKKKFDFSDDLFPDVFRRELRFMCYKAEGYWGDIGEFPSYRRVVRDVLDKKVRGLSFDGTFYDEDTPLPHGSFIQAPAFICKNVRISNNVQIGPYCTIGNDCVIGQNVTIENSIIGNGCKAEENCDIRNALLAENVYVHDNCFVDDYPVISYGCTIGRFSRIFGGSKIWPGRKIAPESVISSDMFYETPETLDFDIYGMSGRINSAVSLSDTVKLGHAFASVSKIDKIGVGYDGKLISDIYHNALTCGLRACGGLVYDYGEMAKIQAYFYSSYCSLDAFIFVSVNGDILNFTFYGKNGLPFTGAVTRQINNNYRFSSFNYASADSVKEKFNMSLFTTVYKSCFTKLCGEINIPFEIISETENKTIKEILDSVFEKNKNKQRSSVLQFLINPNGTDIYIVENEKFYSSERILLLLCEMEFASGHSILVPEDAPSLLEEKAEKYGVTVKRAYEGTLSGKYPDSEFVLDNIWCFDPVMMCGKLINVMSTLKLNLEQLFECCEDFSLRKTVIELDSDAAEIRLRIKESGAVKSANDNYYIMSDRKGRARIRQLGNSNRVRILAEAYDMETAKELSVFAAEKIKNADIDKTSLK